ncbi:MAG: DUF2550 domain-containing protein [Humibacillus sp.]|nr:DUF2550 domain-containing protein [Humibacillus sp.]MDN5779952.1 DUF2550 domain-containing protein [Humibacillus sp.]
MPTALFSTEIVVGTLLLLVVFVLATTFLRRRVIARGLPLTLCGLRESGRRRWRLGHIRFGDNALEWYSLGGVSLRPRHRWDRQSLMLNVPQKLAADDRIAVLPDASGVSASAGNDTFELALQGPAYTALRSWQEAAPPGYNVNVA